MKSTVENYSLETWKKEMGVSNALKYIGVMSWMSEKCWSMIDMNKNELLKEWSVSVMVDIIKNEWGITQNCEEFLRVRLTGWVFKEGPALKRINREDEY